MLGDITLAKDIYIACGYTDMRKSIDGLAAVVQEQFHLDHSLHPFIYSVGSDVTESNAFFGREMVSACCINVW